jgi:MFS family permease
LPLLGTRAAYWTAGAVIAVALWTSACPTMTYPLYEADWHISTTIVALVFAAYPLALIPVLVLLGNLSDHIGRRASMLLGLGAELVGVLLFVAAHGVPLLLAGRAFMGLGVGLSIGTASVAMVEFSPPGRAQRVGAVSTAISAAGIALAMLVGGALTQYAPYPLRLNFVVLAGVIVLVAALVAALPQHPRQETAGKWRVRPIVIPRGSRTAFVAGALAFASSFLLGSIVLPLGAKIAQQLAGSANSLVTGALLSVFAACITVFALLARRMPVRLVAVCGAGLSIAAVWLYVLTGAAHSLALFFLASAVGGAAYAFDFAGGLTVFNRYAAPRHRASTVSGGYLAGYLAQGIGAPALGAVVTGRGLMSGLLTGATAFTVFFAVAMAATWRVLAHQPSAALHPTDAGTAPGPAADAAAPRPAAIPARDA